MRDENQNYGHAMKSRSSKVIMEDGPTCDSYAWT